MNINKAIENMKFDVRLVDYNIKHSILTEADVKSQENNLPDSSSACEPLRFTENEGSGSSSDPIQRHQL